MSEQQERRSPAPVVDYDGAGVEGRRPPFQIIQIPGFSACRFADYPQSRIFQACRSVPIQIIRISGFSRRVVEFHCGTIGSKKTIQRQPGDIA